MAKNFVGQHDNSYMQIPCSIFASLGDSNLNMFISKGCMCLDLEFLQARGLFYLADMYLSVNVVQQLKKVDIHYLEFTWTGKPCSSVTLLGQNCCKRGIIPDEGKARTGNISENMKKITSFVKSWKKSHYHRNRCYHNAIRDKLIFYLQHIKFI